MNSEPATKARIRRYAVLAICAAPVVLAYVRSGQQMPAELKVGQPAIFDHAHDKADVDKQHANRLGPVTEEDWIAAEEFLKQHAPVRYDLIKRKIPPDETREGLKRFLVNKWRGIVQLEKQSPELYKTRVREIELDDEVFGICLSLKHNRGDTRQLQSDLNAKISELFDLGLTERKQRIGIVERSLVDQKKSLENDEHDKAKLIQQYYETVLTRGVEGARLDAPHRKDKTKSGASTTPSPGENQ